MGRVTRGSSDMDQAQQHLQREGRACYKRQNYEQALGHFNRAIGRAPSASLLDNRAACHEKLNDLPAALKDAKKAIQLTREDPTGYLRAGKVLVKMEKPSVALEIYAHGLRSVKHAGQGYELLRRAQTELRTEMSPTKSVDPLTVLPRELAEIILEYLSFQQRMNACLVSAQWAGFIRSSPDLWHHLDLSTSRKKVSTKFISRAINIGQQRMTTASLSNLYDLDKSLHALTRHCPITALTLLNVGLQSDNLLQALKQAKQLKVLRLTDGVEIGTQTIQLLVLQHAATLEEVQCHPVTAMNDFNLLEGRYDCMTALSVRAQSFASRPSFFERVTASMPYLRSLTAIATGRAEPLLPPVLHLEGMNYLQYLNLEMGVGSVGGVILPPTIASLRFASTTARWLPRFPDRSKLPLPSLKRLTLHLPIKQNVLVLRLLMNSDEKRLEHSLLEYLDIALPTILELLDSEDLPTFVELRHLSCKQLDTVSEEDIARIVKGCPKLQTIDLSGSTIDGVMVKRLVLELRELRHLIADDCRLLGRDAVDWARSQGVRVDARSADAVKIGRKVRYAV
ncbi:hypothetical protein LTR78_002584 [Recurvomyces mirabilis]|uniref:F-box domain-containing protein n=1 Tax=Recurvomyces mirabilis TaxID=574656 RepID=A0AAE0WTH4_9PEZI|nr:hypothetical protein LTR78_002584 [Recurvomyces mirabilis]KAK5157513.1 hypothetical protein LTS14_004278 [Recurvomyces mirabilis]